MINPKYLKYLREDKGMTQLELAIKASLTPVTISDIERGKRPNCTEKTINGIAKALEVEPAELLK
jgi:transcriptional regulator with XRE-family HTH domain